MHYSSVPKYCQAHFHFQQKKGSFIGHRNGSFEMLSFLSQAGPSKQQILSNKRNCCHFGYRSQEKTAYIQKSMEMLSFLSLSGPSKQQILSNKRNCCFPDYRSQKKEAAPAGLLPCICSDCMFLVGSRKRSQIRFNISTNALCAREKASKPLSA